MYVVYFRVSSTRSAPPTASSTSGEMAGALSRAIEVALMIAGVEIVGGRATDG